MNPLKSLPVRTLALAGLVLTGILSILATGGGGGGSSSTSSSTPATPVYPQFAYVANRADDSVSTYAVDSASGRLHFVGKVAAGTDPSSVAVDPSGRYAYVANLNGGVSQYTIDTDGSLTPMTPATVTSGTDHPVSVTVDPSGRWVYVANAGGTVAQYTIGTDGSLTAMTPATVQAGTNPNSVTVDPSGRSVYVANFVGGDISQYTIGTDGSLMPMSPAMAGASPMSVAVDPSGRYAYVPNRDDHTVSQYTIGADGSLEAMSPATVQAGTNPRSVAVDPSGRYAYVANSGGTNVEGTVSQYTIGADGKLAPMTPTTVGAGYLSTSVTVDPSGHYAYVTNSGDDNLTPSRISQYTIDAGGSLTANTPSVAPAYTTPVSLAVSAGANPVAAVPEYAYVANEDGTVSQYTVGTDGSLAPMTTATVPAGMAPTSVTVDPSDRYAYVTNFSDNTVSQYTIGTGGGLAAMNPATAVGIDGPLFVTVDPLGRYAYVADGATPGGTSATGTVSQYTVGSDGSLALMLLTPVSSAGHDPQCVTVDPSGRYAYVANLDGTVWQYLIRLSDGDLIPQPGPVPYVGAGDYPTSVTVDPSGRYAYVANQGLSVANQNGTVSQYTIGTDGTLAPMNPATVPAGMGADSVSVDPSDRYAYVTNYYDNTVSQYTIGTDGSLTPMNPATVLAGMTPDSVTVDPSGHYVYVANRGGTNALTNVASTVSQYTIGTDGRLAAMTPATVEAGASPRSVTTLGHYYYQ